MTLQQRSNSKNRFCTETRRLYPSKGFLLCFNNNFSKLIKRNSKFSFNLANLSSNLQSTVLVQKPKFGGIKNPSESTISHKFPKLFISENGSLSCKLFRNTNTDRGILGKRSQLAPGGVLNFHFLGRTWRLKEPIGIKNRGLKN